MEYFSKVKLKNGLDCTITNAKKENAEEMIGIFSLTHAQTDNLLSMPEECTMTVQEEEDFLQNLEQSEREVELMAQVDGKIVGSAGIEKIGNHIKTNHRAEFGISIDKAFWGLGIGKELTKACIECAKRAGYTQIELQVVSTNTSAISLYKSLGFIQYGVLPCGFCSKKAGEQELVFMYLPLK